MSLPDRSLRVVQPVLDRTPSSDVHPQSRMPNTLRAPTPAEASRGVAIAHFSVYRGIIARLRPGERFQMETRLGTYEMSARNFEGAFPNIIETPSYLTGTDSTPDGCYYSIPRTPPRQAAPLRVAS